MSIATATPITSATATPVPDPGSAPTPRPIFPLGWLRGLAALAVVFFHAYQNNRSGPGSAWPFTGAAHQAMLGTDLFVDLFFVLSGLVLWLPIARACADGVTARPGRVLLLRRMARLLPLYFAVVLVVWTTTNPALPGNWQDLVLHLTFTHVYSDQYIFWTDGPAWSLAVEFHYYVLMALAVPLVNAAVRRTPTRRGRLAVAVALPALSIAVGLGYLAWATLTAQGLEDWSVWFSPLSRGADFGLGMGLAVASAAGVRLGGRLRLAAALLGTATLGALVMVRPDSVAGQWWHPLYAAAIALGITSIVLHDGPWPRVLDWRPLARVGALGYGVYLIHEPVMRFLGYLGLLPEARPGPQFLITALLVVVPTLALAWLSSRTLEAAGLRLLATMDRDGRPRDYYDHLGEEDLSPTVRTRSPAPAGAPRGHRPAGAPGRPASGSSR